MDKAPVIIGLSGCAGAGKTTIAEHLRDKYDYSVLSFAEALKRMVAVALTTCPPPPEILAMLQKPGEKAWSWQELVETVKPPFIRWLLQWVGTDLVRNQMDVGYWVSRTFSTAEFIRDNGKRIVFSDLRFPNEAEMIRNMGGQVWRIVRTDGQGFLHAQYACHASETSLDAFTDYDVQIVAPTGVHFLLDQVDSYMEKLGARHGETQAPQAQQLEGGL